MIKKSTVKPLKSIHRPIRIDRLYECKNESELDKVLKEGVFSHLLAGIVGYILGKKTGIKIQGQKDNVARFKNSLENIKKDIHNNLDNMSKKDIKKLADKYRVKIIEK